MQKKAYHHGNLEENLIEAGLSLVDKEGLENLSLRRIAAGCGVSHAAPYKHFSSKEELLDKMQKYVEECFADKLEEAYENAEQNKDAMISMAQAYLRFFSEKPQYFRFFQRQQGDAQVNLSNMSRESNYRPFEVFKSAAVKRLEALGLPDTVRDETIIAMWAMVHGCTSISVMSSVRYDGDWAELLRSILQNNMTVRGHDHDRQ